jgi:hypothetical protein
VKVSPATCHLNSPVFRALPSILHFLHRTMLPACNCITIAAVILSMSWVSLSQPASGYGPSLPIVPAFHLDGSAPGQPDGFVLTASGLLMAQSADDSSTWLTFSPENGTLLSKWASPQGLGNWWEAVIFLMYPPVASIGVFSTTQWTFVAAAPSPAGAWKELWQFSAAAACTSVQCYVCDATEDVSVGVLVLSVGGPASGSAFGQVTLFGLSEQSGANLWSVNVTVVSSVWQPSPSVPFTVVAGSGITVVASQTQWGSLSVNCFSSQSGQLVWNQTFSVSTNQQPPFTLLMGSGSLQLVYTTPDGSAVIIQGLDVTSGATLWSNNEPQSSVACTNGVSPFVVTVTAESSSGTSYSEVSLTRYDPSDGSQVWSTSLGDTTTPLPWCYAPPSAPSALHMVARMSLEDTSIVQVSDGGIVAINAYVVGSVLGKNPMAYYATNNPMVSPAVNHLGAFDFATGGSSWSLAVSMPSFEGMYVANERLYVMYNGGVSVFAQGS